MCDWQGQNSPVTQERNVKNLLRELHCASTQQKVCILSEKGVIHWPRTSTPKTKYFFTFTSTSAECERNRSTLRVTSEISCVYTNCRRCKHACLLLRLPQTMLHVSGTSPLKCHRHDWPQCNLFQLNSAQIQGLETLSGCED